jgi:hypothetical protein
MMKVLLPLVLSALLLYCYCTETGLFFGAFATSHVFGAFATAFATAIKPYVISEGTSVISEITSGILGIIVVLLLPLFVLMLMTLVLMLIIELFRYIITLLRRVLYHIANTAHRCFLLPLYHFHQSVICSTVLEEECVIAVLAEEYVIRSTVLEETLKLVAEVDKNCLMGEVWNEEELVHVVKVNFDYFLSHSELMAETKSAVTQEFMKYVKDVYGFKDWHGYSIFGSAYTT